MQTQRPSYRAHFFLSLSIYSITKSTKRASIMAVYAHFPLDLLLHLSKTICITSNIASNALCRCHLFEWPRNMCAYRHGDLAAQSTSEEECFTFLSHHTCRFSGDRRLKWYTLNLSHACAHSVSQQSWSTFLWTHSSSSGPIVSYAVPSIEAGSCRQTYTKCRHRYQSTVE